MAEAIFPASSGFGPRLLELLSKGTPLLAVPFLELQSVDTAEIDAKHFDLPGPVIAADELEQKYASVAPLRVAPEAADVADAVCWLLEGARRVTGDIIYIDGGMHIASPRK